MKHFPWIFLLTTATAMVAAEPLAPELVLRINGRAAAPAPLPIARGEPVIAEVVLRSSDRSASQPIPLDPPAGGWAARVKVAAIDATGAITAWPFVVVGKPSGGALALQPNAVTTLVLRLDSAATAQTVPGHYNLLARLDLADGRGWRGVADSEPVGIEIADAPASPAGEALGRRQLFRVRAALLAGDVPRAQAAADELLHADFLAPEGYVAKALIAEAGGDRRNALVYVDIAMARATGIPLAKPAPGAPEPTPKPVPLEYYDLRQRIERMPSNEPEPEPLPGYPDNVVIAPANATPSIPPSPSNKAPPSAPLPRNAVSAPVAPVAPTASVAIGSSTVAAASSGDAEFSRDPRGQWATAAEASSVHGSPNYSAQQATGAPNVTTYADHPETWVGVSADRGEEWLKLTFASPVRASAVRVRQVLGPGTIVKIEVFGADGRSAVVWSGRDRGVYAKNQIAWFVATFPSTDFPVHAVKLTLDTSLVLGWNSIDAVQLVGDP